MEVGLTLSEMFSSMTSAHLSMMLSKWKRVPVARIDTTELASTQISSEYNEPNTASKAMKTSKY